jgi:hypothetical protein
MKKLPFLISVFLLVLLSVRCNTTKNTPKTKKYTELDASTIKSLMEEYYIEVPNTWCSYLEAHNDLAYSPKDFILKGKMPHTNLYVLKKRTKKSNNIDNLTSSFVKKKKYIYKSFNYDLVKGKHPIYGRYNFIIYKTNENYKDYTVLSALILKDNYYYEIRYTSLSKYYKVYADDVVKMIYSFKIKE